MWMNYHNGEKTVDYGRGGWKCLSLTICGKSEAH